MITSSSFTTFIIRGKTSSIAHHLSNLLTTTTTTTLKCTRAGFTTAATATSNLYSIKPTFKRVAVGGQLRLLGGKVGLGGRGMSYSRILRKEEEEEGGGGGERKDLNKTFDALRKVASILETNLQKPEVPSAYPQVLALPINKRPLFPGFYKAVVIKNPQVCATIKELVKRGQPYVGAFLAKDDDADFDVISDLSQVHTVGTFAQITNLVPSQTSSSSSNITGADSEEEILTVVLYPHRRIRIKKLLAPKLLPAADSSDPPTTSSQDSSVVEKVEEVVVDEIEHISDGGGSFFPTALLAQKHAVSVAEVENVKDEPHSKNNQVIRAISSEIVAVFKELATMNPLFREQVANFSMRMSAGNPFEEPAKLADFAAAVSAGESNELQGVLESVVIEERMQKALLVLKKELMNAELQSKIRADVESKIQKRQREYYLMEQLRGIKKELGLESDGKDKLIMDFQERVSKLSMPEPVKKVFDEELRKLEHLEPAASEFNVSRNYLDWLTQIPWGKRSAENYSLSHAIEVLEKDHYGLKDVKDRILEFIAVGKLRKSVEGKIICLVGPPGVGKTSIGKSIARALSREFYRFSVGGLSDVAEIKGHRRTYVGAMPGKIVQALKKVQTENPLVLIDEVDKIGKGHQGDPASALLEMLDPEQNNSFLDHYMDVPIDLSKVLFVCTANVIDTIPGPLLDRMEVIQLSGYVQDEKVAIAERYLIPQALEATGLTNMRVDLPPNTVEALIKGYCRESGVRSLKKHIEKLYRKAAYKAVQLLEAPDGTEFSFPIGIDRLKELLGSPIFTSDRLYETTPPGVVMGLAWTGMGGSALYVESIISSSLSAATPGSTGGAAERHFNRTGQLGKVMKESSTIAYTYAQGFMTKYYPDRRFFEHSSIHLHVPEGATPKDGPSAGITMTSSLLSLALGQSVPSTLAMTGELTLTGKVLRIGGLKEKVIAAKRSGVDTVIFPASNQHDWEELSESIREGIRGIPVNWYDDVAEHLGFIPPPA